MELLLWHEALGSDDEQADEQELLARVLYHFSCDADGRRRDMPVLRTLHAMQGLLAFGQHAGGSSSAWMSVTLSTRRFYMREVEPKIFMALGVTPTRELKEHKRIYEALARKVYESFRLLHGSIDSNLRQLAPSNPMHDLPPYADGLELLLGIQTLRKRLRKLHISLEDCSDSDNADPAQQEEKAHERLGLHEKQTRLQQELDALTAVSTATRLWKKCDAFFPQLLQVVDLPNASCLDELVDIATFPMDAMVFLEVQSFINRLQLAFKKDVSASVLFFKGHLLWSTVQDTRTLRLVYEMLRLREEHGMMFQVESDESLAQQSEDLNGFWMKRKYQDTFRPVWASKDSYAECAMVSLLTPHPRKGVRSFHKQALAVPLRTLLAEISASSSDTSSTSTSGDHGAEVRKLIKARGKSVSYRNTGFLLQSGLFAKSFELENGTQAVWAPAIHAIRADDTKAAKRALAWHDSDLTLVVLLEDSAHEHVSQAILRDLDSFLETQQIQDLAVMLLSRVPPSVASSGSATRPSTTGAPNVYRNRVEDASCCFQMRYVPRLIKTKEPELFPLPTRLHAHYFPQHILDGLNVIHAMLRTEANQEVCIKTAQDGWILGKYSASSRRELYALFDTKVASLVDLADSQDELLQDQFGTMFF